MAAIPSLEVLLAFLLLAMSSPAVAQAITYFSDVPLYSSLVQCASTAIGEVLNPVSNCGNISPVAAYGSCACLKDQNSASITSQLNDEIGVWCDNSATADMSSVIAVYQSWCAVVAPRTQTPATSTAASAVTSGSQTATPGSLTAGSFPSSTSNTTPTPGGGSGMGDGSSNNLSKTDQIIIGVAIPLVTLIAAIIFGINQWRRRQRIIEIRRQEEAGTARSWYPMEPPRETWPTSPAQKQGWNVSNNSGNLVDPNGYVGGNVNGRDTNTGRTVVIHNHSYGSQ